MAKKSRKKRFKKMAKYKVLIRDLKGFEIEIKMKIKVQSVKYINLRAYNFIFYMKNGKELGRISIKAPNYKIAKEEFKNLIS